MSELTIENVVYSFQDANFMEAKKHAFSLGAFLDGALNVKDKNIDINLGRIVAKIGSHEMEKIEAFVLENISVREDGKHVSLKGEAAINAHFNKHRSHYVQVIYGGMKHHFLDFVPNGGELLKNMSLQGLTVAITQ